MKVIIIKKKALLILPLILIGIMTYVFIPKGYQEAINIPILNKIVVIDAGHGGVDPGAIGDYGKHEDDINLEIVLKLRRLIEQSGGIVILTREEDVGLYTEKSDTYRGKKNEDLRNRKVLVNESDADVFLTVHLNSFPQSQYHGAHAFYKKGSEKSKKLALIIQEEFRNTLDKNNARVPQPRGDSIYLLKESESPAVLLECGFLSNEKEERMLNNPQYQEKVAWAIYIGLLRYFKEE